MSFSPQRLQGSNRGAGGRYDKRASTVHRELRRQIRINSQAEKQALMKRAGLYLRVSTIDRHQESGVSSIECDRKWERFTPCSNRFTIRSRFVSPSALKTVNHTMIPGLREHRLTKDGYCSQLKMTERR